MTGIPPGTSKFWKKNVRKGGIEMQRRICIQPRFWLFVIALMLVCFGASFAVTQVHYDRLSEHVDALTQEKIGLMDRVDVLTSQLSYVSTDAYVERVARDELNMIRPGEIRYVSN